MADVVPHHPIAICQRAAFDWPTIRVLDLDPALARGRGVHIEHERRSVKGDRPRDQVAARVGKVRAHEAVQTLLGPANDPAGVVLALVTVRLVIGRVVLQDRVAPDEKTWAA